jgi:glycosyltransferase involved in cell wall biosynthesis
MQLVLAGNTTGWTGEFLEKLSTFKYRSDVHVITNPSGEVLIDLIGAAYAFVYPAQFDYFPVNIILAMRASVPVIASAIPVIQEAAGKSVLYPGSNDEEGFAKTIQEIYKDENRRSQITEMATNNLLAAEKYDLVGDCRDIFKTFFTSKS